MSRAEHISKAALHRRTARWLAQRVCGWILALLVLLLSSPAWAAPADLVLILRPADTGPRLREAIHRLRGELTQHGFQVEVLDVAETPGTAELERRADEAGAAASVVLLTSAGARGELDRVDVWMCDRITGKTLKRTLSPDRSKDAPTVLAIRTVDLLRSSFAEPRAHREAPEIEGAHPERAATAVHELRAASNEPQWLLGAGVSLGLSASEGDAVMGGELSGGFQLGRLGGRVVVALAFAESGLMDSRFSLTEVTALGEPFVLLLSTERFDWDFFPSIGASYVHVRGNVGAPYEGREDSTWVVTVGGGMSARYFLSPHFGFYSDVRALVLLPTPTVEIGSGVATWGAPLVTAGFGAVFAL